MAPWCKSCTYTNANSSYASDAQRSNRFHCLFQDINKRLSLPADIRIPDGYLEKLQFGSPPFDQPLSRRSRRASLVSALSPRAMGAVVPSSLASLESKDP